MIREMVLNVVPYEKSYMKFNDKEIRGAKKGCSSIGEWWTEGLHPSSLNGRTGLRPFL